MQILTLKQPQQNEITKIEEISSQELFKGQRLIKIMHRGQEYLLRVTRQGKLILTK